MDRGGGFKGEGSLIPERESFADEGTQGQKKAPRTKGAGMGPAPWAATRWETFASTDIWSRDEQSSVCRPLAHAGNAGEKEGLGAIVS